MNIYKVLPDLKHKRQLGLWHKALRSQWSAEDLDWSQPRGVRAQRLRAQLARVLTPVLMGEQSALYSVSSLIPVLGHQSQVEAQFYLTTWAVDEARHTELFARFYGRLECEPLSIRRFPSGYLFQSQIVSKEPAEWLAGVLVSEVLAKLLMEEFRRLDLDPVLSEISHGILDDEARHLAFNHLYLEERFRQLFDQSEEEGTTGGERLRRRLEQVLTYVPPCFDALGDDLKEVGIDTERLYHLASQETRERLETSIRRGARGAAASGEPRSEAAALSMSG